MAQKPLDPTRLWKTEDRGYETPCWTWVRFVYSNGYGQYRIRGRTWLAHRYMYTRCVGPIPAGLEVDHLCFNKACVNPDHLEAVTPAENSRRSPRTKLTHAAVIALRETPAEVTSRSLAPLYGVNESTICAIRSGRYWAGVGAIPESKPRVCGNCGVSIDHLDVRSKFCCLRCKTKVGRARRSAA